MADKAEKIRVKTMCLITDGQRVLVGKGRDSVKNENFYRVLGGSLRFNETVKDGIMREIKEELGCGVENLELVDVIENLFTYEGEEGHEIVFLFKGTLSDPKLYKKDIVHIIEDGYEFDAEWIPNEYVINKKIRLYPEYEYSKILARR